MIPVEYPGNHSKSHALTEMLYELPPDHRCAQARTSNNVPVTLSAVLSIEKFA